MFLRVSHVIPEPLRRNLHVVAPAGGTFGRCMCPCHPHADVPFVASPCARCKVLAPASCSTRCRRLPPVTLSRTGSRPLPFLHSLRRVGVGPAVATCSSLCLRVLGVRASCQPELKCHLLRRASPGHTVHPRFCLSPLSFTPVHLPFRSNT